MSISLGCCHLLLTVRFVFVQNSQEARAVKASLNDLPQSPEVVASKKNLFEAGEAWSQSPSKGATCKVRGNNLTGDL